MIYRRISRVRAQEVYEYNLELYYEDSDDKEMRTISRGRRW